METPTKNINTSIDNTRTIMKMLVLIGKDGFLFSSHLPKTKLFLGDNSTKIGVNITATAICYEKN